MGVKVMAEACWSDAGAPSAMSPNWDCPSVTPAASADDDKVRSPVEGACAGTRATRDAQSGHQSFDVHH
jgi:hypothetical protein